MIRKTTLQLLIMFTAFTFGQTSIESSGLFTTGSNANYPYVIAGCFLNDGNSGEEQTLQINITSLPVGATYRVFKTTASGQDYVSNPQPLDSGINNINVSAISVARTVKFQFSSGAIEFDSLIVNGEVLYDSSNGGGNGDGDCVGSSNLFSSGANANFPFVYAPCSSGDANYDCSAEQTVTINITSLPEGGAQYRKGKTVANGNWAFFPSGGEGYDLSLGENILTIGAATFDRSVRFQFSSADICYDSFSINGTVLLGINDFNNMIVNIHPNPAKNMLTISGLNNIDSVKVYSVLGRLEKEAFNTHQIDISDLASGVYMVKVNNGSDMISKKIIKQ